MNATGKRFAIPLNLAMMSSEGDKAKGWGATVDLPVSVIDHFGLADEGVKLMGFWREAGDFWQLAIDVAKAGQEWERRWTDNEAGVRADLSGQAPGRSASWPRSGGDGAAAKRSDRSPGG